MPNNGVKNNLEFKVKRLPFPASSFQHINSKQCPHVWGDFIIKKSLMAWSLLHKLGMLSKGTNPKNITGFGKVCYTRL